MAKIISMTEITITREELAERVREYLLGDAGKTTVDEIRRYLVGDCKIHFGDASSELQFVLTRLIKEGSVELALEDHSDGVIVRFHIPFVAR